MTPLEREQAKEITKLRHLLQRANTRVSKQRRRAELWRLRWRRDRQHQ